MILHVKDLQVDDGHGGCVSDISFSVAPREILFIRCRVLLLGSTLLRALLGMAEEAKGEVWLGDENLLAPSSPSRLPALRRDMAMVYRERGLISLLTVEQNIALPLGYHYNVSRRELAASVHKVAERLHIEGLLPLAAEELDEMQTRLVNLARALIRRPRLLLIDGIVEGMPDLLEPVVDAIRHYQTLQDFGVVMTGRHQGIKLATRALELGENGLEPIKI